MLLLAPPNLPINSHEPDSHNPGTDDAADGESDHGSEASQVPGRVGAGPQVSRVDVGEIRKAVDDAVAGGFLLGRLGQ